MAFGVNPALCIEIPYSFYDELFFRWTSIYNEGNTEFVEVSNDTVQYCWNWEYEWCQMSAVVHTARRDVTVLQYNRGSLLATRPGE